MTFATAFRVLNLAVVLVAGCTTRHNLGAVAPPPDAARPLVDAAAAAPGAEAGPLSPGIITPDAGPSPSLPPSLPSDVCPPGLATPAEIAASPRADANLEMLALWISNRVVAPQATYDRIARDVPAIKQKVPALASKRFLPPDSGTSMMLQVSSSTLQQMRNRNYPGWKCANELYVALPDKFDLSGFADFVVLEFKGAYNMTLLSAEYARMPGVMRATSNGFGGIGGPWETICATPEGDTWHYVFGTYLGMGGAKGTYQHFSVGADGVVKELERYEGGPALQPGSPTPEWVTKYVNKAACHVPG